MRKPYWITHFHMLKTLMPNVIQKYNLISNIKATFMHYCVQHCNRQEKSEFLSNKNIIIITRYIDFLQTHVVFYQKVIVNVS